MLIDGKARPSCTTKASTLAGKRIQTIEGLPADHPVKQAWIDEQVPQCGYCQSGQITRAVALPAENPSPDDEAVRAGMERNLCRCGTYPRIHAAGVRPRELPLTPDRLKKLCA